MWKHWAQAVKQNIYALYLVARDPRIPLAAKIIVGLVVAYALSPIDLIPDFIPVIGYLDDMLLLPLGIWLAIKLIPRPLWEEYQSLAQQASPELPGNYQAAAVIIIMWMLAFIVTVLWFLKWTQ